MKRLILEKDKYPMQALLFVPQQINSQIPLMIYLHGAGERGNKIEQVCRHAIPKMLTNGHELDAMVLCPQCPAEYVWNNVVRDVKQLIDLVAEQYNILKDRICITGSSMGGFGTWEMALTYKTLFSAIAPVAGGGLSWRCSNLITTPVIAYHGTKDTTVPVIYSQLMVDSTNACGGQAKLVLLEGKGHNDGIESAYQETDLIEWLLSKRRTDFSYVKEVCEDMF